MSEGTRSRYIARRKRMQGDFTVQVGLGIDLHEALSLAAASADVVELIVWNGNCPIPPTMAQVMALPPHPTVRSDRLHAHEVWRSA
jgi:hypothetical protein